MPWWWPRAVGRATCPTPSRSKSVDASGRKRRPLPRPKVAPDPGAPEIDAEVFNHAVGDRRVDPALDEALLLERGRRRRVIVEDEDRARPQVGPIALEIARDIAVGVDEQEIDRAALEQRRGLRHGARLPARAFDDAHRLGEAPLPHGRLEV